MRSDNLYQLPSDLPVPTDDGACDHLPGSALPPISLKSTGGSFVLLGDPSAQRTIVYCYPHTGVPDREPPGGIAAWNKIPGARGCTPQTCAYQDRFEEFRRRNVQVFGLSTQTTDYQREMVDRLHVPFEVLSDCNLELTRALKLPTFEYDAQTLLKRLTLVIHGGKIEHVFYPVFPPDQNAEVVLAWLDRFS